MDWFRWWHGTVNDPKFQLVARRSKTSTANALAIWACVLECASNVTQCDAGRARGDAGAFNCDAHDVLLGLDEGVCASVLTQMEILGMIENGVVAAWDKRQPKREDSSTARTRAYRERQKKGDCGGNVTQCDDDVTQCDAPEKIRVEESIKENTNRISDESADGDFYLTKKKKKLTGKRLETFLQFWEAFNYKKDKAPAADAWLAIPQLTDKLVVEIVEAAKKEAKDRPALMSAGKTPKMAEGWLTNRRWEDEESVSKESPPPQSQGPLTCEGCIITDCDPAAKAKNRGCNAWTDE